MHMRIWLVLAALLSIPSAAALSQTIPAFPGADGAAANVSGGRGGIVYHVTKLNSAIDDPARNDFGTLRYGLTNSNFPAGVPRTIVFDVGGVFNLGRLPQSGWDPNGNGWDAQSRLTIGGTNVTLAGQTAPGAGVIFMGGGLKPQGNNNIIRNITVAAGYGHTGWWKPGDPFPGAPGTAGASTDPAQWFPDNVVYDAMDIAGTNIMIDHVSTLFATDETISMNEVANNITVQYSNISQGQNYPQWDAEGGGLTGHALGSLLSAAANASISFHHNLYAHQKGRVPQMGVGSGQASGAYYDFRNNVFYNWFGTAGSKSGSTFLNLASNFYLAGNGGENPIGGTNPGINNTNGGTGVISASTSIYRVGNVIDSNRDGDPNDGVALAPGTITTPFWSGGNVTYRGTTDTARVAFDRVLDYVGANWWTRDNIIDTPDERIIHEARTGTGKIIAWADNPWNDDPNEGAEWRALKNTPAVSRAADWDNEPSAGYGAGDGMPTWWELQHGLDPNVHDHNGDFDNDGYTNLEEYLNDIAAWPAPNAIIFNNARGDGRFAHILNWDANPDPASVHNWQPSRFDTAVIDNGTVAVDAVGQHAGNVLLATGAGNNATLNITAGWLQVSDEQHGLSDGAVVIGDSPAATAALHLSGGKLIAKSLLKGAGGTFHFTGGTLSAETVGFTLVNEGGTIAPGSAIVGASLGMTHVQGDLTLTSGVLELEVGGTAPGEADILLVDGSTTLGGTLRITPMDLGGGLYTPQLGDQLPVVASQLGTTGLFDHLELPELGLGQGWIFVNGPTASYLEVIAVDPLFGDYNNDGSVDAADYTVWRDALEHGTPLANELATPGVTDEQDYLVWRNHFGNQAGAAASAAVPEPATWLLLALTLPLFARRPHI